MKPLLKWPGGKRRIAPLLVERMSPYLSERGRFVELFTGSAAAFFALEPQRAVLVDVCKPLMAFYEAVKREPEAVSSELEVLLELPFGEETFTRIKQGWNGNRDKKWPQKWSQRRPQK